MLSHAFNAAPARPQVLFNLAGNSAKFTTHGRIELSACMDEGDSSRWLVTVADTGCGIPAERLEVIRGFGTQGRAGDATKGTGIGLCFVEKVCSALYGASPKIESKEGEGTTISFLAKLAPVECGDDEVVSAEQVRPAPCFDYNDPTPRRCLVIDDSKPSRTLLQITLKRVLPSSWTILEAASGEEAVEMATEAEQPFDLATIDFYMPQMNGAETTAQLKALSPSTVCIGVTGNAAGSIEVRQLSSAGCVEVWSKPPPPPAQMQGVLFGLHVHV